jgi:Raf kinase inhibitor-like YbhB/YbcL family protein
VPPGSKSLVLIIEDPDAPSGLFMHWAAYDTPPATNGLPAGYGSSSRPGGGVREGRNDFETEGYRGPCPPRGGGAHNYVFRLLAISRPRLDLAPTASDADALRAAQPYVIQQAELTGTYHR